MLVFKPNIEVYSRNKGLRHSFQRSRVEARAQGELRGKP